MKRINSRSDYKQGDILYDQRYGNLYKCTKHPYLKAFQRSSGSGFKLQEVSCQSGGWWNMGNIKVLIIGLKQKAIADIRKIEDEVPF